MQQYDYRRQPWTESARLDVPAVQIPHPTGFSPPAGERQPSGAVTQQPPFPDATAEVGATQLPQQGEQQFQNQAARQPQSLRSVQEQPRQLQQPQLQQPTRQLQQPTVQQLTRQPPVATSQQLPRSGQYQWTQQPVGQSVGPAAEQPTGVQAAAEGQTSGTAQQTGGEQTMATVPESQSKQQAEVPSLQRGMPSVDIYETPDDVIVFADVPGCTPDDIELLGNENSITLVASRGAPSIKNGRSIQRERMEEVERTIALPARADIDEAEATVEDGVCQVTLPKSEDDRKKRIGIQ